ncbi:hypothetical protein BDF22DRAFT_744137 [Syncephalis plumigaleata]|nr:hypothetical protein BDF22DRAFT_744137 [Syncephalis plumigaleata]
MNIISITAVAALLLALIESAESAGQPKNPQVPKMYLGQPTGLQGAFGEDKLMLLEVPDKQGPVDYIEAEWNNNPATLICVDPSKLEGDTVHFFYAQHALPLSRDTDLHIKLGSIYFGHVVATPSPFGKQCYVIDNACKYTYEQHIENLSKKMSKKEESFNMLIHQITSALMYAKVKANVNTCYRHVLRCRWEFADATTLWLASN